MGAWRDDLFEDRGIGYSDLIQTKLYWLEKVIRAREYDSKAGIEVSPTE